MHCVLLPPFLGSDLAKAAAEGGGFEGLRTFMRRISVDAFKRKVAAVEQYEPGLMAEAQRFFLLSQTDSLWKEHLQVCGTALHWQVVICILPAVFWGPTAQGPSPCLCVLLQAIKFLQQAVGLRGYAAKDPLTEFKLEGYNLFVEMSAQIRRNVIYNVYQFQPNR